MSKCYTEMVATIIEESGRTFFRVRTRLLNLFVPSRFSEVHSTVFPTFHRPTQHFEALIVVMVWQTAMKWDFKLICSCTVSAITLNLFIPNPQDSVFNLSGWFRSSEPLMFTANKCTW